MKATFVRQVARLATVASVLLTVCQAGHTEIVTLTGALDASQVVAPIYSYDPITGDQLFNPDGSPVVLGSTPWRLNHDGSFVLDSSGNKIPVSSSTAMGFATVTIDTFAETMDTVFWWRGLTGVADRAHVHDAPTGVSRIEPPNDRFFHEVIESVYAADDVTYLRDSVDGGFVDCLDDPNQPNLSCAAATGSLHDTIFHISDRFGILPYEFADMAAFVVAMKADGLFLDIHTEAYSGGEIRGQLLYSAVPEPGTLALVGIALLSFFAAWRRRT